jgi:hypothetical protein
MGEADAFKRRLSRTGIMHGSAPRAGYQSHDPIQQSPDRRMIAYRKASERHVAAPALKKNGRCWSQ